MSIDDYLEEKAKRKGGAIPRNQLFHDPGYNWKKTVCQSCQKVVQYVPKKDWDGRLICPHCKTEFKVPSLDKWVKHN